MDKVDNLTEFLRRLINSDEYGGRAVRTDTNTVILYDCSVWTETHLQAVKQYFPECDVSIQHSHMSLSGFIVIVKICKDYVLTWTMAVFFAVLVISLTVRYMAKIDEL